MALTSFLSKFNKNKEICIDVLSYLTDEGYNVFIESFRKDWSLVPIGTYIKDIPEPGISVTLSKVGIESTFKIDSVKEYLDEMASQISSDYSIVEYKLFNSRQQQILINHKIKNFNLWCNSSVGELSTIVALYEPNKMKHLESFKNYKIFESLDKETIKDYLFDLTDEGVFCESGHFGNNFYLTISKADEGLVKNCINRIEKSEGLKLECIQLQISAQIVRSPGEHENKRMIEYGNHMRFTTDPPPNYFIFNKKLIDDCCDLFQPRYEISKVVGTHKPTSIFRDVENIKIGYIDPYNIIHGSVLQVTNRIYKKIYNLITGKVLNWRVAPEISNDTMSAIFIIIFKRLYNFDIRKVNMETIDTESPMSFGGGLQI